MKSNFYLRYQFECIEFRHSFDITLEWTHEVSLFGLIACVLCVFCVSVVSGWRSKGGGPWGRGAFPRQLTRRYHLNGALVSFCFLCALVHLVLLAFLPFSFFFFPLGRAALCNWNCKFVDGDEGEGKRCKQPKKALQEPLRPAKMTLVPIA